MIVTLKSRAFLRSSSNPRRTTCSGRGDGARNLGLSTILGESTLESLETRITGSSLRRRHLRLGALTVWPMRHHFGPLRRKDKGLYLSSELAIDHFDRQMSIA